MRSIQDCTTSGLDATLLTARRYAYLVKPTTGSDWILLQSEKKSREISQLTPIRNISKPERSVNNMFSRPKDQPLLAHTFEFNKVFEDGGSHKFAMQLKKGRFWQHSYEKKGNPNLSDTIDFAATNASKMGHTNLLRNTL